MLEKDKLVLVGSSAIADEIMGREIANINGFTHWVGKDDGLVRCKITDWKPAENYEHSFMVFDKILDPNRTSIEVIGNGSTGLLWQVCYDGKPQSEGITVQQAIYEYAVRCIIQSEEEGETLA